MRKQIHVNNYLCLYKGNGQIFREQLLIREQLLRCVILCTRTHRTHTEHMHRDTDRQTDTHTSISYCTQTRPQTRRRHEQIDERETRTDDRRTHILQSGCAHTHTHTHTHAHTHTCTHALARAQNTHTNTHTRTQTNRLM